MTEQQIADAMLSMANSEKATHLSWLGKPPHDTSAASAAVRRDFSEVLELVKGGPTTIADVVAKAGLKRTTARYALNRLLARGQIKNTVTKKGVTAKYVAVQ